MVRKKETGCKNARTLKSANDLWEDYKKSIPKGASEVQFVETKRAFYAGLTDLLIAFEQIIDIPEDKALTYLKRLNKETTRFWEEEYERCNIPKKQTTDGQVKDR